MLSYRVWLITNYLNQEGPVGQLARSYNKDPGSGATNEEIIVYLRAQTADGHLSAALEESVKLWFDSQGVPKSIRDRCTNILAQCVGNMPKEDNSQPGFRVKGNERNVMMTDDLMKEVVELAKHISMLTQMKTNKPLVAALACNALANNLMRGFPRENHYYFDLKDIVSLEVRHHIEIVSGGSSDPEPPAAPSTGKWSN